MSAHDSIISAQIKQTRNANRKRQIISFKEGDFVYLSTKIITFAQRLARKLIPNYIGPYRITQDFTNQSSEDEWVVERMPDLVKMPSLKFSGKLALETY